jgi:hypothetical protein
MASQTITINDDRISPLSIQEEAGTGFSHKFTVLSSDIALAAANGTTDTVTVTIGSTPARWYVNRALANVRTAFAGSGGLTLAVGTSANSGAMIAATSVLTAGVINVAGSAVANAGQSTATSAATLQLLFTNSVSGSPSALTAGAVDVYLNLQDAAQLP